MPSAFHKGFADCEKVQDLQTANSKHTSFDQIDGNPMLESCFCSFQPIRPYTVDFHKLWQLKYPSIPLRNLNVFLLRNMKLLEKIEFICYINYKEISVLPSTVYKFWLNEFLNFFSIAVSSNL